MRHDDALLDDTALQSILASLPDWEHHAGWLTRTYRTDGWRTSILIVNAISFLAEAADHHPDIELHWGSVVVRLQTHTASGVTAKDATLAAQVEQLIALNG